MADNIRRKRLAGTIRRHLSEGIAREVADPRLAALSIQEVEMTGDLSIAKVQVRLMFGGEDESARTMAMAALTRLAPGLRASVAGALRMRNVPELRFVYDEGADKRARISEVLDEIKRDDAERTADLAEKPKE